MQKEIQIPMYDATVVFFVNRDFAAPTKYLKEKFDINEKPEHSSGWVNSQFAPLYDTTVFYMYINPEYPEQTYWNSISHELFHLTQEILEARQIYFKRKNSNEPYAYLQGYLMQEGYDFWKKAYNKFKVKK